MKFGKSFYPPLVAAFPVLCVFSANLDLIPLGQLWRPLGAAVAVSLVLWILASLAWRDTDKGAVTASFLVAFAFAFTSIIKALVPDEIPLFQFGLWGAITLAVSVIGGWKLKWAVPLNVLAAGCVLAAAGQIGFGLYNASRLRARVVESLASNTTGDTARPDVINIILDGYGRTDQLKRAIGFSNDDFIDGLRKRGFYVADQAHSNYCQTELSIASSLNMNFIQAILPRMGPTEKNRDPLTEALWENGVARRFRSEGYRFISITTGFPPIRFLESDLALHDNEGITWFESAIIQMTPFSAVPDTSRSMMAERRRHIHDAFSNLELLASPSTSPRFVVAHILAPHPPFVFNADGTPRPHKGPFGFWDGSDYMTYIGDADDYRKGYTGQTEYLDTLVLKTIDKLLAVSGQKPVIVIQGDHGSKVGLDQNSLEKTDLKECFSNLCAFYGPESVRSQLYPSITPVNYFRVVFKGLFGDPIPLLPDRSWYSTYPLPYALTDVTQRLTPADPAEAKK